MSEHRVVERLDRRTVGKQIVLPFSKALEISIKSLQIRFRRSLITVGLIMLAMAFLMTIFTGNAFENALVARATEEVPWGGKMLSGYELGNVGYVLERETHYRVTKAENPRTGKLEETRRTAVDPNNKEEMAVAAAYVEKDDGWRAQTNELRMGLTKRGLLAEGLEQASVKDTGKGIAIAPQQWWLISLSLTVAVVGITNAMLMSVAERYREIGTMKCLGALDSFIIRLFLLESVFQGTSGTIVGVVVGFVMIFLYTLVIYGWMTLGTFPAIMILIYAGFSVAIGFA